MIVPINASASSQPQRKAIARRTPAGMLSRTITVTTETGAREGDGKPQHSDFADQRPHGVYLLRAGVSHPFPP
jgi:hypothetical protein